ncbi:MAG: ATP-dependent helicase HrpB [Desulfosarcinaceae bacterium]
MSEPKLTSTHPTNHPKLSPPLPIEGALPELLGALARHQRAVLCAPPGAGKTTRVPLALLETQWCAGRSILVLVPRRMAARSAAGYMAALLGETVGNTVGYQIRMERRIGPRTRIEVLTEGVLTRRLQRDPELGGVACVIFDEFHERHLEADLALALCLDLQGVLHPDLRLLVMSATLAVAPLVSLLDNPPVITSQVARHPVETHYRPLLPDSDLAAGVSHHTRRALDDHPGSLLAFLPGAREIRSVARRLERTGLPPGVDLYPLYGQLPPKEQAAALVPAPAGRRKVVLATNIAETSLTIEGVQVVVDSGFCRSPRLDPRSGMSRLVTRRISRASARQRRGRAGRTGPGVCLRLWDRNTHAGLVPFDPPEILVADLSPLALELAAWGSGDPGQLRWLDPPPAEPLAQARSLLVELGALDEDGRITAHGRRMVALPLHPRLAHMVRRAETFGNKAFGNKASGNYAPGYEALGEGRLACLVAALLGERDPLHFAGTYSADLHLRVAVLLDGNKGAQAGGDRVDPKAVGRIRKIAGDLERHLGVTPGAVPRPAAATLGLLLAWAYPDRVALKRRGQRGYFQLANGKGAWVDPADPLAGEEMLVAAHLDGDPRQARIFLAAAYEPALLETQFASRLETCRTVRWDGGRQRAQAVVTARLGALVLAERPWPSPPPEAVQATLLDGLRQTGLDALPWDRALTRWVQRATFAGKWWAGGDLWPGFDPEALMEDLDRWLGPYLPGCRALQDLTRNQLRQALAARLTWAQQRAMEALAPTHVTVPSGSRLPVDYGNDPPVLKVRIQEMFGATETPAVAGGRQPLLLHLLSPAQRPMQVTQDLAQFWLTGYPQIKKELHGRYPRHHWPEDPLTAPPTRRAKGRRT